MYTRVNKFPYIPAVWYGNIESQFLITRFQKYIISIKISWITWGLEELNNLIFNIKKIHHKK